MATSLPIVGKAAAQGVIVFAHTGRDATLVSTILMDAGLSTSIPASLYELRAEAMLEASAILIAEESLTPASTQQLLNLIHAQPEWSDIPLLVLTSSREDHGEEITTLMNLSELHGNVTLIERPIRIKSFLAAVRVALGDRKRQFQVRDHVEGLRKSRERLELALKDKALLLREVHHRVKNNLQVIAGLLEIAQNADYTFKTTQDVLLESQQRVTAMAMVHEQLHQEDDLTRIDLCSYITSLAERLMISWKGESAMITLSCDIDPISLNLNQAMPCGLILNELISNALKHAFPNNRAGVLSLSAKEQKNGTVVHLCVKDDGVGFSRSSAESSKPTTGMLIVRILAKQLQGELAEPAEGGSTFCLTFPKSDPID